MQNLVLPRNLCSVIKKTDHLSTAFDRYTESLLERVAVERTVANAIMGIEALLSNDNAELSFKLQTRVSKLLAALEFSALTVKSNLNKAYAVRSNFAHGGYLSDKERAKLEACFGGINNFALTIINYLRIVLLITFIMPIRKDELIKLIDDSLIDEPSAQVLKNTLAEASHWINYTT